MKNAILMAAALTALAAAAPVQAGSFTLSTGRVEPDTRGFDAATTHRPGARFGPAAIRAASAQLAELSAFPWGFDPFDHLAVADYGDCFLDSGFPDRAADAIETHARRILAAGPRMLTFGGDHFVTWPLLPVLVWPS